MPIFDSPSIIKAFAVAELNKLCLVSVPKSEEVNTKEELVKNQLVAKFIEINI